MDALDEVPVASRAELRRRLVKRSADFFVGSYGMRPSEVRAATQARVRSKIEDEYSGLAASSDADPRISGRGGKKPKTGSALTEGGGGESEAVRLALADVAASDSGAVDGRGGACTQLSLMPGGLGDSTGSGQRGSSSSSSSSSSGGALPGLDLVIKRAPAYSKPVWHAPWKLMRVISGHQGWVRALAVEPGNEWFVSGGADRLIKIWDLATGTLKLSLTGHVNTIRGLVVSPRHPYIFSCGEDHMVKCWDLEYNKVIRDYHGHLSGVYCLTLHPALDVLATGGRDAVVRVWDVRTKQAVHVMGGHTGTVMSVVSQTHEPQIISGSMDKMVRCWDLAAGKTRVTLTNHKKSIRGLAVHPREYTFASAGADNVKVWKCPEGRFERNFDPSKTIVNALAIKDNPHGSIAVGGADQGYLFFWDWKSGYNFQTIESRPQPGSMAAENGIFDLTFDKSETRLITAECDKTIKIWKEDENATPETHPVDVKWRPKDSAKRF